MKYLLAILLCIGFYSCDNYTESEMKTEKGVVVGVQYNPEINATGSGVGITSNGSMAVSSVTVHEREKYLVVLQCDQHHKMFTVEDPKVWGLLQRGDSVLIHYTEWYKDSVLNDYSYKYCSLIKKDTLK